MIKLVSYDIWKTLIKSNPVYVQARATMIAETLGFEDRVPEVKNALRVACDELDGHTDLTGIQHGVLERLQLTAKLLDVTQPPERELEQLVDRLSDEHIEILPVLTESTVPDTLRQLHELGMKVGVISNTGMTEGRTLRAIFERLGIRQYVDYEIFSDEVGIAKPDMAIFTKLAEQADIEPSSIIHIGDNELADFGGATSKGLHALLYAPNCDGGDQIITSHAQLLTHSLLAPKEVAGR